MTAITDGPLSALALCWRIERPDGAGLGLTGHDQPLVVDRVRFGSAPGILPSAIVRGSGLEAPSGEVAGALTSNALTESDLAIGRWDGASVAVFAVDWSALAEPPLMLVEGELGEVSIADDGFTAELRGAAAKLEAPFCPETSPHCRAELGDKQCRVDLAGRSVAARVVAIAGTEVTIDIGIDARFAFGRLRWMSGANCGAATTILSAAGNQLVVRDPPRLPVAAGTRVVLREGCNKAIGTCATRFANAANFRGEPYLPGNDLLTRYPGA